MPAANDSLKEAQLKDFEDRFVPEAETTLQFAGIITGTDEEAYNLTKSAFQNMLSNFHQSSEQESAKLACFKSAAEAFLKSGQSKTGILKDLGLKEKVAVALTDSFGLSIEEVSEILGCELVTSRSLLAAGRKSLLRGSLKSGTDAEKNLVIGYISDFISDNIPAKKLVEFKKALAVVDGGKSGDQTTEDSIAVKAFVDLRHRLAAERVNYSLNLEQLESIRTLAEEPTSILAREHKALEILGAAESRQTILRWVTALLVLFGLGAAILVGQSKLEQKAKEFDPLLYLGNETEAFEYDYRNRLDFPVRGLEEVHNFLVTRRKSLGHSPAVLSPPMFGVNVLGASVLDYEPRKVSAVLYLDERSTDIGDSGPELVALYCYDGSFKSLDNAPKTDTNGHTFQTYTSNRYNMVAFENGEDTICMLMGRMAGGDLIKMASQRY